MTGRKYVAVRNSTTLTEQTAKKQPWVAPRSHKGPQLSEDELASEAWLPFPGYEGRYQVSSMGRVKSTPYIHPKTGNTLRGKVLKTQINRDGYERFRALGKKNVRVHRAVAIAFLPNPDKLPLVNHKDGDKLNNRLSNLEWESKSGNSRHAIKSGLIDSNHLHSLSSHRKNKISPEMRQRIMSDCKTRKEQKLSLAKIAAKHGVSTGSVLLISRQL